MYEEVCYRKSFLKQVIVKVDFASPLSQLDKGVPKKLLDVIVDEFPIVEPNEFRNNHIMLDDAGIKTQQQTIKQWNFFSKDRTRQLTLAPQTVFISENAYSTYEQTKKQFKSVINALSEAFPDAKSARFGLRYINQIDVDVADPTRWDGLISTDLISSRNFFQQDDPITRLINIVELVYGDIGVRFQFGLPNPDHPAPVRRPLFILDLDASVDQAHDLADVMGYMDAGHDKIQAIYERSITDHLRERMDAKPVQQ